MKKIFSSLLITTFLFGMVGCKQDSEAVPPNVEIWATDSAQKILKEEHEYSDSIKNDRISVLMAGNEYEGAQVILTPDKDIENYTISLGDLVHSDGETKIEKENISIYVEKYLIVSKIFDTATGAKPGKYPDALVPYDSIVEYGQNKIEAGCNQGIYLEFKTEYGQKAGAYKGNFTIQLDGVTKSLPIEVNVADVSVPEERHAKNIFLFMGRLCNGELNSSQEIFDAYSKALFDYRLSPNLITEDFSLNKQEDIDYYTERAYILMQDKRCTNITIPYSSAKYQVKAGEEDKYGVSAGSYTGLNTEKFEKVLLTYLDKSLETGFDMFEKSVCYFGFIDEATEFNLVNEAKVTSVLFKDTLERVAQKIEEKALEADAEKHSFYEKLAYSVRHIKNVVTSDRDESLVGYVETFCPKANYYDSAEQRAEYSEQEEQWWYTCMYPRAPYPTYHVEDTLLSARLLGWMQAEYNVVGNLYWSVDNYAELTGGAYQPIEDYFEGTAVRYPTVNGEGFLFYPGGQYGLLGPVGSMRLQAIRDGYEEFELIYALKQKYGEKGELTGKTVYPDKAINSLTRNLYSGTVVATDESETTFLTARETLLNLYTAALSEGEMCIVDYVDDGFGTVEYKVFLKSGYTLKCNGGEIVNTESLNGENLYTIRSSLTKAKNELEIYYEANGKKYAYNQYLGGKTYSLSESELNGFEEDEIPFTAEVVNDETSSTKKAVSFSLSATENAQQAVRFTNATIKSLNEKANKVVLIIKNNTEADVTFNVQAKYKNDSIRKNLTKITLKPGENKVEISLSGISWNSKSMDYWLFVFGDTETEPERTFTLSDIVVYEN